MIKVVDKEEISHNQYDEIINDTEFRTWCNINNEVKFLFYKDHLLGIYYPFVKRNEFYKTDKKRKLFCQQ